jgi:transketolase
VLPPETKARLAVEPGVTLGWHKWVGERGDIIGLDRFGESAPGPEVLERLGYTVENVVARAAALLERVS